MRKLLAKTMANCFNAAGLDAPRHPVTKLFSANSRKGTGNILVSQLDNLTMVYSSFGPKDALAETYKLAKIIAKNLKLPVWCVNGGKCFIIATPKEMAHINNVRAMPKLTRVVRTSVKRDRVWQEWIVTGYNAHGEIITDYHTDDREDAERTAAHMTKGGN